MAARTRAQPQETKSEHALTRDWRRWILGRFWFVHSPVILMINASPATCLHLLAVAARPAANRLHHRNLFTSGRRYQLRASDNGFRLTTTSKVSWHYRRRTRSAAVMHAWFQPLNDTVTRVELENHSSLTSLLEFTLIPTFMTSIIVFVPYWHPVLIGICVVLLYMFSWMGQRYNAALEANEMIFFVQKALEDLEPAAVPVLEAGKNAPDIVYQQQEFELEWEKFYRRHSDDL